MAPNPHPLRLSRVLKPQIAGTGDDSVPVRRALAWALAGLAILGGVILYFRYARLLVPLLG